MTLPTLTICIRLKYFASVFQYDYATSLYIRIKYGIYAYALVRNLSDSIYVESKQDEF